jgi:hypothetical protein
MAGVQTAEMDSKLGRKKEIIHKIDCVMQWLSIKVILIGNMV